MITISTSFVRNSILSLELLSTWRLIDKECWWKLLYLRSFYATLRSSRPEVFYKKVALWNFAKFRRKHLCLSLMFNKVAGACNFNKNTPAQASPCKSFQNFAERVFWNTCWRLLLYPLISMFHSRKMAHKINTIHKRALKLVYEDSRDLSSAG